MGELVMMIWYIIYTEYRDFTFSYENTLLSNENYEGLHKLLCRFTLLDKCYATLVWQGCCNPAPNTPGTPFTNMV